MQRESSAADVLALKDKANARFRIGDYEEAVQLYTEALKAASEGSSPEVKRQLLSNRAQAYLLWSDPHNALAENECALSPEYTTPDSDKNITAKCLFRQAKLLHLFCREEEARDVFAKFQRLRKEQGSSVTDGEWDVLKDIAKALKAPAGSKARRHADLLRAMDHRGIIVPPELRPHFPYPPTLFQCEEPPSLPLIHFTTVDARVLPHNPLNTPLSIPFHLCTPNLWDPTTGRPFTATLEVAEDGPAPTLGAHVPGLFPAFAAQMAALGLSPPVMREVRRQAARHRAPNTVLLVVTIKTRFLAVPHEMPLREMWAAARWPRLPGAGPPLRDVRTGPRKRPWEIDGIVLHNAHALDLVVLPRDDVQRFMRRVENDL